MEILEPVQEISDGRKRSSRTDDYSVSMNSRIRFLNFWKILTVKEIGIGEEWSSDRYNPEKPQIIPVLSVRLQMRDIN